MVKAKNGSSTNATLIVNQLEVLQQLFNQTKVNKAESTSSINPMVSLAKQGNTNYSLQMFGSQIREH